MIRWVHPFFTGDVAWIVALYDGNVYYSVDNFANFVLIKDMAVDGESRLFNHGTRLRIAGGLAAQPQIVQEIDRDFFYTGPSTSLFSYDALSIP